MKNVAYYNGKMGLQEELTIPFLDRAMFFGDGVYDATYSANRKIFEKDWHLERFYNSLKAVKIPFKLTKEELLAELQKCIDAMDSDGICFVYWEVTRGTAPRNHLFPNVEPNLIINITESKLTDLRTPCKLITEEDTRFFHCNIKTLNLLPSVLGSQKAFEAGAKEVVFHRGERVTECAHTNVNIIKDGEIVEKKELSLPETIENVIKCKNPRCITSIEQELKHVFILTDREKKIYRCKYCEEKYGERTKERKKTK